MKAKLIYEFNLPEDQEEMNIVENAGHYKATIDEFDQFLRNRVKHGVIHAQTDLPHGNPELEKIPIELQTDIALHVFELCRDTLWNLKRSND